MVSDLSTIATQLGMSLGLLIVIIVWVLAWKLIALWKSARNNQLVWFIVLGLVNTMGILEILYIFIFHKLGIKEKSIEQVKPKVAKRKTKKVSKKRK
jgi:membrane protein YdbS with pleckstrin-like domain